MKLFLLLLGSLSVAHGTVCVAQQTACTQAFEAATQAALATNTAAVEAATTASDSAAILAAQDTYTTTTAGLTNTYCACISGLDLDTCTDDDDRTAAATFAVALRDGTCAAFAAAQEAAGDDESSPSCDNGHCAAELAAAKAATCHDDAPDAAQCTCAVKQAAADCIGTNWDNGCAKLGEGRPKDELVAEMTQGCANAAPAPAAPTTTTAAPAAPSTTAATPAAPEPAAEPAAEPESEPANVTANVTANATATVTDPCKDETDAKDKAACQTAHLAAPDCACNDKYKHFTAVVDNGRDDVNTDECKNLQKLFDCSKKKENWEKCKVLAGTTGTYDKSVFKTQEDHCAELIVSPASSSRAGFLVAIGAVGAAALML